MDKQATTIDPTRPAANDASEDPADGRMTFGEILRDAEKRGMGPGCTIRLVGPMVRQEMKDRWAREDAERKPPKP